MSAVIKPWPSELSCILVVKSPLSSHSPGSTPGSRTMLGSSTWRLEVLKIAFICFVRPCMYIFECMCHVWKSEENLLQFVLPSCHVQQAWRQAPSLAEPSHWPVCSSFSVFSFWNLFVRFVFYHISCLSFFLYKEYWDCIRCVITQVLASSFDMTVTGHRTSLYRLFSKTDKLKKMFLLRELTSGRNFKISLLKTSSWERKWYALWDKWAD